MQYLEEFGPNMEFKFLKESNWQNKIEDIHSYYNGFWIKVSIQNRSKIKNLSVSHRRTFEKKIIINNEEDLKEFPLISFREGNYKFYDKNRIRFKYKVEMPLNKNN